jgi:hypothetical protein
MKYLFLGRVHFHFLFAAAMSAPFALAIGQASTTGDGASDSLTKPAHFSSTRSIALRSGELERSGDDTLPAVAEGPKSSKKKKKKPTVAKASPTPTPAPGTPAPSVASSSKPTASPAPARRNENLSLDTRFVDMRPTSRAKSQPTLVAYTSPSSRITSLTAPMVTPTPSGYSYGSSSVSGRYGWKSNIVTTVFWIGEPVGGHNFTPNVASSWDAHWTSNYGGYDNPNPEARRNFIPAKFTPRQNPFYVALPYNDVTRGTTKPEARVVIPWFREAFRKEGQSVCRDRWVAVRNRSGRVAYAQWSDCGPFRTDHWQYVFGMERPKPNLNQGAGLDVSPAMRDYLGLSSTDVTDWKFVDAKDVPNGPWALYGENNTFVQRGRLKGGTITSELATRAR